MKTLIKLIVVELVENTLWRVGIAYTTFYRFKDSINEAAMQGTTEADLKQKVVELARTYDLPVTAEELTVTRDVQHVSVRTSYTSPVAILPGYEYRWPFTVDVDAYVLAAPVRR